MQGIGYGVISIEMAKVIATKNTEEWYYAWKTCFFCEIIVTFYDYNVLTYFGYKITNACA